MKTDQTVPNDDPLLQSFWPAQRLQPAKNLPIAFCHVEGEENASAIKTSHSNEQSKANMKEVRKVVGVMCDGIQISTLKLCTMILVNDRYMCMWNVLASTPMLLGSP